MGGAGLVHSPDRCRASGPLPDDDRIAQLTADREAAYADFDRLREADPGKRARLAVLYAARLRELESQSSRGSGNSWARLQRLAA